MIFQRKGGRRHCPKRQAAKILGAFYRVKWTTVLEADVERIVALDELSRRVLLGVREEPEA